MTLWDVMVSIHHHPTNEELALFHLVDHLQMEACHLLMVLKSADMLAKKCLHQLAWCLHQEKCTRQPYFFVSTAKPMQLSLNFMFSMEFRALACLSFTMMLLWEWLESIKRQKYLIAQGRQKQYYDIANLCMIGTPFANWGGLIHASNHFFNKSNFTVVYKWKFFSK